MLFVHASMTSDVAFEADGLLKCPAASCGTLACKEYLNCDSLAMHDQQPAEELDLIEIDGSYGEGGGQMLRTSLALSCLTGQPVRVYNIRSGRETPGLKPQHLMSAYAAADVTGGELSGAVIGSMELVFRPGAPRPGVHVFDVSKIRESAGSVALVFQTVLPPLLFADGVTHLRLRGGTHVKWSPPSDYISEVFRHTLSEMGAAFEFDVTKRGYYPAGGGEVTSIIRPAIKPLSPLTKTERGRLKRLTVTSTVSRLPLPIAGRQLSSALQGLEELAPLAEARTDEAPSFGPGTSVFILAEFENIRAGFSALGERGKRAEDVGMEAAQKFMAYYRKGGALDPRLSDQIAPYLALAEGESSVSLSQVTNHLVTNIHVIERFLAVKFDLLGAVGEEGYLKIAGAGYTALRATA